MKKSLIVLLVMVLAAGFAFAGSVLAGKYYTGFSFDLDKKAGGFVNTPYAKFRVELDANTLETANEGSVYAELKANLVLRTKYASGSASKNNSKTWYSIGAGTDAALQYQFDYKYANIVAENWTLSVLKTAGSTDLACDEIDYDLVYDGASDTYYMSEFGKMDGIIGVTTQPGVEFKYDKYSVSAGFTKAEAADAKYSVAVKATDVEVAEGAKISAGFAIDETKTMTFSGKVAYASDAADVTAAADFGYKAETEGSFQSEASLVANVKAIDGVALKVRGYWLDNATVKEKTDSTKLTSAAVNPMDYYGYEYDTTSYKLSKVLTADVNVVVAGVDATVTAKDLLNQKAFGLYTTYSYDVFDFVLGADYTVKAEDWDVYAKATYNHELFSALAQITVLKGGLVKPKLKVSSSTLVSGASLFAQWNGAKFGADTKVAGTLSAGCTIAF